MKTLSELFEAARSSLAYSVEGAIIQFTEHIVARMEALGVTRKALAERLNTSPAYVTKFLRGDTNFTLESMVKIAETLGLEVNVQVLPKAQPAAWAKLAEKATAPRSAHLKYWHQSRAKVHPSERDAGTVQTAFFNEAFSFAT